MPFDVFQQVFFLSYASNLVNDLKGTQDYLQRALQDKLTHSLPLADAGWQVVWGPVVWKNESEDTTAGPDNLWYVAFHPSLQFEDGSVHPTYATSIAGTPDSTKYVWIKEDLAVDSVVDFNAWVAGGIQNPPVVIPANAVDPRTPYIATGAVHAVHILLTTPAPACAASPGTTLAEFFANVDMSGNPRFTFSGHSLGGMLSPSLALALVSAGVIPADRSLTYPTAGPSPGNAAFTGLFTQTFPTRKLDKGSSYKGWNLNLVNTLDIVPQVWCPLKRVSPEQCSSNIPLIYGRPIAPSVLDFSAALAVHSLKSGVMYKPLPSQYFTGPLPPTAPKNLEELFQMNVSQHIQAYINEAGIPIQVSEQSQPDAAGLGLQETWLSLPSIANFRLKWALEHPEEIRREIGNVEGAEEVIEAFREMFKEV